MEYNENKSGKKESTSSPLLLSNVGAFGVVLLLLALLLFKHQSPEGEKRQETEESIAKNYLYELEIKEYEGEDDNWEEEIASLEEADQKETDPEDTKIHDDNYYVRDGITYTPDYAKGRLDYVLTIPSISLERGVYTGTPEEIQHDLDIWMTVTARSDYELGKTHYVIYGHNHTEQNLSFNRLQTVPVGDYFTLTGEDGVYLYLVTDFFSEWRELVTSDYADNFKIPADKCYIVTCGRGEYRYKDILVEGTLQGVYDISTWNKDKEQIVQKMYGIEETKETEEVTLTPLFFDVKLLSKTDDKHNIEVSVKNEKGELVPDVTVSVFDLDGITISLLEKQATFKQENDSVIISSLPENEYVLGVTSLPKGYEAPKELLLNVKKDEVKVTEVPKETISEKLETFLPYTIYVLLIVFTLFTVVNVIIFVMKKVKETKEKKNKS